MSKKEITLNDLALMVKDGFDEFGENVNNRFDKMENQIDNMDNQIKGLKQGRKILA
ncbi:MAG: hypothetical protein ABIE43_01105 [Patescibacteria group bacterium]